MEKTALQKTTFCDFNHPAVVTLAKKLADGETDPKKITEATFKHVRDNIRFGCDLVQVKASETLAKGYGACWNKALLMVALLRSNQIPARLAFNPVKRDFMRPTLGEASETLHETENHCFALVWLNDKWIAVDATLDAPTYQNLFVPHNVPWGIDWNGTEDMRLYTENIVGPIDFFKDIDAAIQQDVGYLMPPPSKAEAIFGPLNQRMWKAIDD
jgi:transglutaminase-like putative cysteine protease